MLAHGFQTLIQTAPGAGLFPFMTEDSLVAFLEQSSHFVKPVFAGDTLYPTLEVDELSPNRTTGVVGFGSTVHNQRRELVLEGRQRFLLRRRAGSGRLNAVLPPQSRSAVSTWHGVLPPPQCQLPWQPLVDKHPAIIALRGFHTCEGHMIGRTLGRTPGIS